MLTFHPYRDGAGGSHLSVSGWSGIDKKIAVVFEFYEKLASREVIKNIREIISVAKYTWIRESGKQWIIDADFLRARYPDHDQYPYWFKGMITVPLDVEHLLIEPTNYGMKRSDDFAVPEIVYKRYKTIVTILMDEDIVMEQLPMKIFLSHKSLDKTLIRRYKKALESVGMETWLDEDAMAAGTNLNRALLAGMNESCAAVFFITPNYVDEQYLATEVDYAITEKLKKQDRFAIITLVLRDSDGQKGNVPPLLQPYVWKEPLDELAGFVEIIRALPIELGAPSWR
jgi:hypothetical protein